MNKCCRCLPITTEAHYEMWDGKTFCWDCAVFLGYKVRRIGSNEPTDFLEVL